MLTRDPALTYEQIGAEVGRLVEEKQKAYGAGYALLSVRRDTERRSELERRGGK